MKCALLDTATGGILREQDFEAVPPLLTPEKGWQWYEVIEQAPPAFNPNTHQAKPAAPVVDDAARTLTRGYTLVELSADAAAAKVTKEVTVATQRRLDDFARTRNYDGVLSACTYATSPTAKFSAEGQYCVEARDATWAKLYEILAEVQAGNRPMPGGYADIEAELPALVWPN